MKTKKWGFKIMGMNGVRTVVSSCFMHFEAAVILQAEWIYTEHIQLFLTLVQVHHIGLHKTGVRSTTRRS